MKKIEYIIISLLIVFSVIQFFQIRSLTKRVKFQEAEWSVMLSGSTKEVQEAFLLEVSKKL